MTLLALKGKADAVGHHFGALDGLRGIAVLAVMAEHFERFVPDSGFAHVLKAAAEMYGGAGVDLFFALSGFLITGILLKSRGSRTYFSAFYARRTLRIFPIYYLTLIVVFGLASFFPAGLDRVPVSAERPLYFLYLTNWIGVWTETWPPNVVGHFWTLGIEEQFYLLWPLCVLLIPHRRLAWTAAGLSSFALVIRVIWVFMSGPAVGVILCTFTRMDDLLLGAFCAWVFAERSDGRGLGLRRWILASLGGYAVALGLLPGSLRSVFFETIGMSMLAVGFSALVLWLAWNDEQTGVVLSFFRNRMLRRIGRYSYGMYVYHVPFLGLCELLIFSRLSPVLRANPWFGLGYVIFLAIGTFVVAMISYECFERPILRIKRFFQYDTSGTPISPASAAVQP